MAIAAGGSGPATSLVVITKSDATDLSASGIRALYIGGGGDVAVIGVNDTTNSGAGTSITLTAVPAGTLLPISPKKVMATNTTATGIVGLI